MVNNTIKIVIKKILVIFRIRLSETQVNGLVEFMKFCLVGVSNSIIYYLFYFLGLHIFNIFLIEDNYVTAHSVAFIVSIFWSYLWNRIFVFRAKDNISTVGSLIKTFITYSFTGLVLNNILLVLWVQRLHISAYIAPLINLIINVPLNYLINKYWSLKKHKR